MPQVSIIMPTYNRADTILRAVRSVQAQTFSDWELIVVDDGSQDETATLLEGLDPRLTLIRQHNQGVTAARNTALSYCRGEYLAFLDSDDEWVPYHLGLCLAFLQAHPAEPFVSTELLEDFGHQRFLTHYLTELSNWYTRVAKITGSLALALPKDEQDHYLRIYQTRHPLGEWCQNILPDAQRESTWHYRGRIFQHWRWGFLLCLPATVIRRTAAQELGPFDTNYPICSDFVWLATCCERFRTNFLAVPTAIKHELAPGNQCLAENHLGKHQNHHVAAEEMLRHFEACYYALSPADPCLAALRSHKQLYVARQKIAAGLYHEALRLLQTARSHSKEPFQVLALLLLLKAFPNPAFCQRMYQQSARFSYALQIAWRGEITFGQLITKYTKHLFSWLRQAFFNHEARPASTPQSH